MNKIIKLWLRTWMVTVGIITPFFLVLAFALVLHNILQLEATRNVIILSFIIFACGDAIACLHWRRMLNEEETE